MARQLIKVRAHVRRKPRQPRRSGPISAWSPPAYSAFERSLLAPRKRKASKKRGKRKAAKKRRARRNPARRITAAEIRRALRRGRSRRW